MVNVFWNAGIWIEQALIPAGLHFEYSLLWEAQISCVNHVLYFLTGVPFPRNFLSIAKTILKRLFRVYAHIYHQHFSEVVQLGEEAHLNTSFKHFIFFVQV
jgi:MOB kinase activator 1